MKKKRNINIIIDSRKVLFVLAIVSFLINMITPVYAASDPLSAVNNLASFMYGLVRAIGMMVTVFAIFQIGLSFLSHDPGQRANGFMYVAGGLLITFAKEILGIIIG